MTRDISTPTSESQPSLGDQDEPPATHFQETGELKITLISLHGLIRAHEPELGRDADTGGK